MGKAPAFQFYPADWVQDTAHLSLAARGAWIDILCALWRSSTRGTLTLNSMAWARVIRSSVDQATTAVKELVDTKTCDGVIKADGITLTCRRIVREEEERRGGAQRQATFRNNGGGNPENWTAIRLLILKRDKNMCAYCGRRADTVDHVIPKSKGGDESDSNLVACCKRCNMEKSNRTPEKAGMRFWCGFDASKLNNTLSNTEITPPSSSASSSSNIKTNTQARTTRLLVGDIEIPESLIGNTAEIRLWLTYKQERGQMYKPTGLNALWRAIEGIPPAKRKESIEHSMSNNWSGLFEKKVKYDDVGNIPGCKKYATAKEVFRD
jgi:5-methylcytosine-specific restriction endonuclease McrA